MLSKQPSWLSEGDPPYPLGTPDPGLPLQNPPPMGPSRWPVSPGTESSGSAPALHTAGAQWIGGSDLDRPLGSRSDCFSSWMGKLLASAGCDEYTVVWPCPAMSPHLLKLPALGLLLVGSRLVLVPTTPAFLTRATWDRLSSFRGHPLALFAAPISPGKQTKQDLFR